MLLGDDYSTSMSLQKFGDWEKEKQGFSNYLRNGK